MSIRVAVEQTGFKRNVQSGIVLQIAETTRLDIPLEVGAVTEEVRSSAEAPLVRSTSSELGQVIDYKQIQSLPLNGRLFQQLVTLTPGAIPRGFADFAENPAAAGARSFVHHSVNGMPWSGNNYLLDGVANNEPLNAFVNVTPATRGDPGIQGPDEQPDRGVRRVRRRGRQPQRSAPAPIGSAARCSSTIATMSLNSRNFFAATKAPVQLAPVRRHVRRADSPRTRPSSSGTINGLQQDQGRTVSCSPCRPPRCGPAI